MMKEFLGKLSPYNLFNYLLPGVIFSVLVDNLTRYKFIQSDIVIGLFLYYFVGLVISRFGSLMLEPLLKKYSFLEFADYQDFIRASKSDSTIEILSEVNNMFRTFLSAFLLVLFLKAYEALESYVLFVKAWNVEILCILLAVLFLYSYRKQTRYVTQRVKAANNQETG